MAEGGGLLNRYGSKAHHRFESCHLRHHCANASRTGYLKLRTGNPFALSASASVVEATEKVAGFLCNGFIFSFSVASVHAITQAKESKDAITRFLE